MSGPQDVIQLPVRFLDPNDKEGFAIAVQRNLMEIERYLSILQGYIKQATGGAVKNLPSTLSALSPDGTVNVGKLSDKYVGLTHDLQLADQAVTAAKVAVAAIQTQHIADLAVTDVKLAAGAVTEAKTNWQTHMLY